MSDIEFYGTVRGLCTLHRGSISSYHRTVDHNRAVGGATDSQHLGWKAADIVLDDLAEKDKFIENAKIMGLFALDETATKNHVHLDDRFNAPR